MTDQLQPHGLPDLLLWAREAHFASTHDLVNALIHSFIRQDIPLVFILAKTVRKVHRDTFRLLEIIAEELWS